MIDLVQIHPSPALLSSSPDLTLNSLFTLSSLLSSSLSCLSTIPTSLRSSSLVSQLPASSIPLTRSPLLSHLAPESPLLSLRHLLARPQPGVSVIDCVLPVLDSLHLAVFWNPTVHPLARVCVPVCLLRPEGLQSACKFALFETGRFPLCRCLGCQIDRLLLFWDAVIPCISSSSRSTTVSSPFSSLVPLFDSSSVCPRWFVVWCLEVTGFTIQTIYCSDGGNVGFASSDGLRAINPAKPGRPHATPFRRRFGCGSAAYLFCSGGSGAPSRPSLERHP